MIPSRTALIRLVTRYAGISDVDVSELERVPVEVLRKARAEHGRDPRDGEPGRSLSLAHVEDIDGLMRANRAPWL